MNNVVNYEIVADTYDDATNLRTSIEDAQFLSDIQTDTQDVIDITDNVVSPDIEVQGSFIADCHYEETIPNGVANIESYLK